MKHNTTLPGSISHYRNSLSLLVFRIWPSLENQNRLEFYLRVQIKSPYSFYATVFVLHYTAQINRPT